MTRSLRRVVLGRTWSIVAPARSRRPQPSGSARNAVQPRCPFCEGNEADTENEVFALRINGSSPNCPGWTLRVVPNKFPALLPGSQPVPAGSPLFDEVSATGYHEVVVDTPQHGLWLGEFSLRQLHTALTVYRSRVTTLARLPGVASVLLFRNEGHAAGASQGHPHTQILAVPVVPPRLESELIEAERYRRQHGRCCACDLLASELASGHRLIAQNDHFVAITSFAARFPYESWIVPRAHRHDFGTAADDDIPSLAHILKEVLCALETIIGRFAFNLVLQTAPVDQESSAAAFHWRLEILPRISVPSGLELGSDVCIVSVAPEDAARDMRGAITSQPQTHRDVSQERR
jgi:UDPglucose--hexose-1-phosphate uridylyltransferase